MTSRDFCYWLQGFIELQAQRGKAVSLDSTQVMVVAKHLSLVFTHEIDPSFGKDNETLNAIHNKVDETRYRC